MSEKMDSVELSNAVKRYSASKKFNLPYKTNFGLVLFEVRGDCPLCNKELSDLRGTIAGYSKCVQINSMGICHPCKTIADCTPIRFYDDGRTMMRDQDGKWIEIETHSWMTVIKSAIVIAAAIGAIYLLMQN